jgi:hypothetical protein
MLKQPTPGLKRVHNRTKQAAKLQVNVAPYDELEVSDDIAAQLGPEFSDGPAPEWPEDWNAPAEDESAGEPEDKPAKKRAARKAAAKK